jgi:hypothetical protein
MPSRPRDEGWEQDHAQPPSGRGLGARQKSSQVYYSQTLRLYKSAELLYNAPGMIYQLEGLGIGQ